jgi:hypothetical protein
MKLHLGVIDVPEPYGDPPKSTYEVGKELEKNYGLFSMFYNYEKEEITDWISKDAAVGLEMMLAGQPVDPKNVFAVSGEHITDKMHKFITSGDVENAAAMFGEQGIPTQAAIDGKSFRFDKGYTAKRWVKGKQLSGAGKEYFKKKRADGKPARPSFMYSGVFEASLKGWIE